MFVCVCVCYVMDTEKTTHVRNTCTFTPIIIIPQQKLNNSNPSSFIFHSRIRQDPPKKNKLFLLFIGLNSCVCVHKAPAYLGASVFIFPYMKCMDKYKYRFYFVFFSRSVKFHKMKCRMRNLNSIL